MTNPSPRPALRKAEDATVHPAAPRPVRAARAPKPAAAPPPEPAPTSAARPRTIADTNRDATAAAARAKAGRGKGRAAPTGPAESSPRAKSGRKKRKFSGSTSDHLRVPDAELVERRPSRARRAAAKADGPAAAAAGEANEPTAVPTTTSAKKKSKDPDLMGGKVVDLGARVPKRLRTAAKAEAKRRGLDLDAVTTELLHAWLHQRG